MHHLNVVKKENQPYRPSVDKIGLGNSANNQYFSLEIHLRVVARLLH